MKGANPLKWICPYKNDITNNLEPQKPVIYSRNLQFSPKNWDGLSQVF
jgi:hypothetical protein